MKYYLDITLLPSDDIGVHFLWTKVMIQMHLALVEIQNEKNKQLQMKNIKTAIRQMKNQK